MTLCENAFAGSLVMVVAPSGAGKSSLVRALLERVPNIRLSISYTTRAPRPGEIDGREYRFISLSDFKKREANGEFLEHAEVHGNHYATSRPWIEEQLKAGTDVLLEIDWQGARQVRNRFRHEPRVSVTGVFILPPSIDELEARLRNRGQDAEAVITRRLLAAGSEIAHAPEFEHVIINQDFTVALDELIGIVKATRTRFGAQWARNRGLFAQLGIAPDNP
ncbi:MAG TPA: guanylate kinase [Burkholderiaceae bacterium]|nr:guanylate kinase [Burkholderiaceae bacterium]